jgi:hypothetical protein
MRFNIEVVKDFNTNSSEFINLHKSSQINNLINCGTGKSLLNLACYKKASVFIIQSCTSTFLWLAGFG